MKVIEIGRVIEITNSDIIVEVLENFESSYFVLNGEAIRIAGVGKFLKVGSLVYQINIEKITDINTNNQLLNKMSLSRKLSCSLIGFVDKKGFHEGSNGETPDIYQKVYHIDDKVEEIIYTNIRSSEGAIVLGAFLLNKKIEFKVDINKFFASHVLIVGNTGSGKSNTVAMLYEKLFEKFGKEIENGNNKFLIIDSNGEYGSAFTNNKKLVNRKKLGSKTADDALKIPINSLNELDWKVLLDATEKTQFPIIRKVINSVFKYIFNEKISDKRILTLINFKLNDVLVAILESKENVSSKMSGLMNVNDIIVDYINRSNSKSLTNNFSDYLSQISVNSNRLVREGKVYSDVLPEMIDEVRNSSYIEGKLLKYSVLEFELLVNFEHHYRVFKYGTLQSNTSPLISRLSSSIPIFMQLFSPYLVNSTYNFTDLEYLVFNKKPIAICDFSTSSKDLARSVVSLLASKLFDNAIKLRESNESFSYHIIIDEAHNYLTRKLIDNENSIAESCIETFERIVKEGRKFNTFLTMATQRPSEITPTLLSQSHNYVIHKLVNPSDISIINNTVPFLDAMSAKMIPIMTPGQAIFTGTAFSKPNIVSIKMPILPVKSETINLVEMWKK